MSENNDENDLNKKMPKMPEKCAIKCQQYICDVCDFKCSKLSNYNTHILTPKHSQNIFSNQSGDKTHQKGDFVCENCEKKYKSKSGLWYHSRTCVVDNEVFQEPTQTLNQNLNQYQNQNLNQVHQIDPNILLDIIKQNQELQKQMIEFMKTNTQTTNNNNTNTNCNNVNNAFNLNVFLNEKCKDAININDFVSNITMKLSDLENFGHLGYIDGVSRILIKNLKELDTYSRPIHCSDLKREVLYIKDNNCWTKETDDKPVLKNAIKQVANKNIKQIQTWKQENPDCVHSDSRKNDQYMKIVMNSMSGGTTDEQQHNISQIMKNVTKAVVIEKQGFE